MKLGLWIHILMCSLLWSGLAFSASYGDALKAYADKEYKKSYKICIDRAKISKGKPEVQALILAGASAWEIDRVAETQMLFETALKVDRDAELPSIVKKKGIKRAFARAQNEVDRGSAKDVKESAGAGAPMASAVPAGMTLVPVVSVAPTSSLPKSTESKHAFDSIATYLPLGLNQFYQGKFFLGLAFGLVQGAAITTAIQNNAFLQNSNNDADREIANNKAGGDPNDPNFLNFLNNNAAATKKAKNYKDIAIAAGAITYFISVIEAGVNPPSTSIAELEQGKTTNKLAESGYKIDLLHDAKGLNGLSLGMNF